MKAIYDYTLREGKALGLSVVFPKGRIPKQFSRPPKGFRWNLRIKGDTRAPDWNSKGAGGLRIWEWAQGDLGISDIWYLRDMVWMAVEYDASLAVKVKGCVKVPRCKTVAISSDRKEILAFIQKHTPEDKLGLTVFEEKQREASLPDRKISIAGDGGIAIAGAGGIAEAGDGGIAQVGDGGVAIAGEGGTAIAGDGGMTCVGKGGTIRLEGKKKIFVLQAVGDDIKPDTFYCLSVWGGLQEVVWTL